MSTEVRPMESTRPTRSAGRRAVVVAVIAGLVVFALLFPWGGGTASDPPTCYGMFGLWVVPCGGWPAVAAGAVAGALTWLALAWRDRARSPAHP